MPAWVYILKCSDGTYYTGYTTDLERRITEHSTGRGCGYTSERLPISLVYTKEFRVKSAGRNFEKQIKGWSSAKKEALIRDDKKLLRELAECRNETHYKYHSNK